MELSLPARTNKRVREGEKQALAKLWPMSVPAIAKERLLFAEKTFELLKCCSNIQGVVQRNLPQGVRGAGRRMFGFRGKLGAIACLPGRATLSGVASTPCRN